MKNEGAVSQGARSNLISSFALDLRLRAAASLVPAGAERILDVGCGEGYFEKLLMDSAHPETLVGIDPSQENIAFARKLVSGASFRKGSAESLPFPDSFFDCVACLEVLDHIHNPGAALLEMRRVLKNDGILILSVANAGNPVWNAVWAIWTRTPLGSRWNECHVQDFDSGSLQKLLAKYGFAIAREKAALFGWVLTVAALKSLPSQNKAAKRKKK